MIFILDLLIHYFSINSRNWSKNLSLLSVVRFWRLPPTSSKIFSKMFKSTRRRWGRSFWKNIVKNADRQTRLVLPLFFHPTFLRRFHQLVHPQMPHLEKWRNSRLFQSQRYRIFVTEHEILGTGDGVYKLWFRCAYNPRKRCAYKTLKIWCDLKWGAYKTLNLLVWFRISCLWDLIFWPRDFVFLRNFNNFHWIDIDFQIPIRKFLLHVSFHILKTCFSRILFATKFSEKSSSGIVKNVFNGTGYEKRNNAIASLVVIIKS